jgi:hypothetical protein
MSNYFHKYETQKGVRRTHSISFPTWKGLIRGKSLVGIKKRAFQLAEGSDPLQALSFATTLEFNKHYSFEVLREGLAGEGCMGTGVHRALSE